ncbi:MAG: hypothetical protein AMXMBFR84_47490 [Candidatus Hydrogenedentota bacterium]
MTCSTCIAKAATWDKGDGGFRSDEAPYLESKSKVNCNVAFSCIFHNRVAAKMPQFPENIVERLEEPEQTHTPDSLDFGGRQESEKPIT